MRRFVLFALFFGIPFAQAADPLTPYRNTYWVSNINTKAGQFLKFSDQGARYTANFGFMHPSETIVSEQVVWVEGVSGASGIEKYPSIIGPGSTDHSQFKFYVISSDCLVSSWDQDECLRLTAE